MSSLARRIQIANKRRDAGKIVPTSRGRFVGTPGNGQPVDRGSPRGSRRGKLNDQFISDRENRLKGTLNAAV